MPRPKHTPFTHPLRSEPKKKQIRTRKAERFAKIKRRIRDLTERDEPDIGEVWDELEDKG